MTEGWVGGQISLSLDRTDTHTYTQSCCVLAENVVCVCACLENCMVIQSVCVYAGTNNCSAPVSLVTASFLLWFSTRRGTTQKVDREETRWEKSGQSNLAQGEEAFVFSPDLYSHMHTNILVANTSWIKFHTTCCIMKFWVHSVVIHWCHKLNRQ